MIFDESARPIFKDFEDAQADANALLALLNSADPHSFQDLMREYNDAHEKAMGIWKRLEPFRIDK